MPFRRVRPWRERPPLRDAWYGIGEGGMCTPMPPSPAGSLPASDPSRKGFEPMKPAMLAVIGTALGASAGHALRAPFPGTGGNPVLDLIAYHDPGLHATIRVWYYAAPAIAVVLAGSLCLSVWRVWLQPRARRRGRGRLPAWPTSPNDAAPSLVVGELHHPTVPCESERPSWLVIPETGLYTGVLVVGAVGSGKTTACMYPFAQQLLSRQADRPGSASFSVPGSAVIAHELGHNLSLYHAPCGPAGDLDPSYPYADGSTGAWGYDFREDGSLMPPHHKDLMSYCGPTWISDYHFTNALGYRLFDEGPPSAAAVAAASLLLWGGVGTQGEPFLEPAFVLDAPPALPDSAGEYRVTGRTASGGELFSLSFAMPEVAHGDGSSSFAFVLPARPGWAGALASITLSGPGGSVTVDGESDLPMAILRNPRTGQVRGILRDLPPATQAARDAAGRTAGPELEVLFSRGIPDAAAWNR